MVNTQLNDFYVNWLGKADSYTTNNLTSQFDKFTTLYTLFNPLYMEVMTSLINNGHSLPREFKDKIAATDYVIQYLGGTHYIDLLLNDNESRNHWQSVCQILDEERIHIVIIWGQQNRAKDLELLAGLRSINKQRQSKAILSLFYHVRCNITHGHKDFEARQLELLVPANHLMRKTVEITFNKLNL